MKSETNPPETIRYEQTFGNIDISMDEYFSEEYTDYEEVEQMDESYNIYEVIGHNDDLFIPEYEKFWVRADYYNNQTGEANKAYILTDAYLHIFKELSIDIGIESVISEDILVIRDSENIRRYHIIDGNGNDISTKYIDEGENIIGIFHSDNDLTIFTISTEDTYSTQNVIFKVYEENKNCIFRFSKQEVNDKYRVEWHCDTETIGISDLGSSVYCVTDSFSVAGGSMEHDYFYSLDERGLYIDLNREKVFIGEKGSVASDGKYIWCKENIIDIDSETSVPSNMEILKYRDTYAHQISNVWNGKFIADTNKGPLYSSEYAIYDCQGNLVCDLESDTVNVTKCNGIYDGYSLIEITNEGGTEYVTVIDENGEWQFEPIQGKIVWYQYIKSTGQFVVVKNDYTGLILINHNGEQEELPISVVEKLSYNGVVLTQTEEGIQYILYNERGHTIGQKESDLTRLKSLELRQTGISDVNFLQNLTDLEKLYLSDNSITNIEPLSNLTNLKYLDLTGNPITDYSPVSFVETVLKD